MHSVRSRVLRLVVLCALLPLGTVALAGGDSTNEEVFQRYCGSCHGPAGEGKGVLSGLLETAPSDLTRLAGRSGGAFSSREVLRFVDGTYEVPAHGEPQRPIWGEVFAEEIPVSPRERAETRARVGQIIEHLRSIQRK